MKSLMVIVIFALFSTNLFSQSDYVDYDINVKSSELRWEGNKVIGGHWGTVNLKGGFLTVRANKITDGEFHIDMKSIKVLDLKENEGKSKLEEHLKSDDFFSTDRFPTATFRITKVTELVAAKKGQPNYRLTGNLTIRSITQQISFSALIDIKDNIISAKADFSIDRTKWNIRYNSGNFFKDLGDKLIKDEIPFKIKIKANKLNYIIVE